MERLLTVPSTHSSRGCSMERWTIYPTGNSRTNLVAKARPNHSLPSSLADSFRKKQGDMRRRSWTEPLRTPCFLEQKGEEQNEP
jgi:hypothetical protein